MDTVEDAVFFQMSRLAMTLKIGREVNRTRGVAYAVVVDGQSGKSMGLTKRIYVCFPADLIPLELRSVRMGGPNNMVHLARGICGES